MSRRLCCIVGNVTVTGFWAYFLYRQRHAVGFRAIARGIMLSDIIFTLVGGAGLTITGILMVRAQQVSIMDTPWLRRGVLMLAISTVVWLVSLLPDQLRMERLDQSDDRGMRRLFTRWSVLGWASTAPALRRPLVDGHEAVVLCGCSPRG